MEKSSETVIGQETCASANVTDEGVAVPRCWYAACVRMNCERKVAGLIASMGIESFVPLQTQIRQWSDRKKKVSVVVIPLIVFIHATEEEATQVKCLSQVSRLMTSPGQKTPAVIPNKQMETLKYVLRQEDVAVEFCNKNIHNGDKVRVLRGCFQDIEGTVVQHENGHLLAIEIDTIGNVLIKIDINDLAKI